MSSQPPGNVEQDYNIAKPGDELPTYDDLAVQGGPNSRCVACLIIRDARADYPNIIDSDDGEVG